MEDVKETLQRKEEPYKNESDLIVKVEKKKFRLFPKIVKKPNKKKWG